MLLPYLRTKFNINIIVKYCRLENHPFCDKYHAVTWIAFSYSPFCSLGGVRVDFS